MRANINLYKDEDVIGQLEKQLGSLTLKEGKSPIDEALDKGQVKVGSQTRKIVKAKRTNDEAQRLQKKQEEIRKRD